MTSSDEKTPEEQARQLLRRSIPGRHYGEGWKADAQQGHLAQAKAALALMEEYGQRVLNGEKSDDNMHGRLGLRFYNRQGDTCEMVLKAHEWGLGGWVSIGGRLDGADLRPLPLAYDVVQETTYDKEGGDALPEVVSWLISQLKANNADLADPAKVPEHLMPRTPAIRAY